MQVLNAGWRLRMTHTRTVTQWELTIEVLNAGWRLRMTHALMPDGDWHVEYSAQRRMASEDDSHLPHLQRDTVGHVLNAGWRLRMTHSLTLSRWLAACSAQRRMASEDDSLRHISPDRSPSRLCSTPDGV